MDLDLAGVEYFVFGFNTMSDTVATAGLSQQFCFNSGWNYRKLQGVGLNLFDRKDLRGFCFIFILHMLSHLKFKKHFRVIVDIF